MLLFLAIFAFRPTYAIDVEYYMDVPSIIKYHGYPVEVYHVTTIDGYILELHRIPHGRERQPIPSSRRAVLFQHGYLCSSFEWVANSPQQSAAFVFADAGFDVWLGNFRGNFYSKNHAFLDIEENAKNFWNFSFDEMAEFDIPALIGKIQKVSKQEKILYVGHSLGSLTMFAKLSTEARFANNLIAFMAMSPITAVSHARGFLSYLSRYFGQDYQVSSVYFSEFQRECENFPNLNVKYGPGELFGLTPPIWLITKYTCGLFDPLRELCSDLISLVVGPMNEYWDQKRVPVFLGHTPSGTSSNTLEHFIQSYSYGTFAKFDRGPERNMKIYGSFYPPIYNLSNIENIPMFLYWSRSDWISTAEDLKETLLTQLNSSLIKVSYEVIDYNHLDFVWGLKSAHDVYIPMLHHFEKFLINDLQ
ncbi:unnamed protein product [Caenorhabditis bovis]|uniref:Lipase n=1 Tax=Caenorhabditis bovis TaxID=2654633 RepID=A0A8S1E092_9PELO|nr:unnamed protein product [Caenorhabditis bovis]